MMLLVKPQIEGYWLGQRKKCLPVDFYCRQLLEEFNEAELIVPDRFQEWSAKEAIILTLTRLASWELRRPSSKGR